MATATTMRITRRSLKLKFSLKIGLIGAQSCPFLDWIQKMYGIPWYTVVETIGFTVATMIPS